LIEERCTDDSPIEISTIKGFTCLARCYFVFKPHEDEHLVSSLVRMYYNLQKKSGVSQTEFEGLRKDNVPCRQAHMTSTLLVLPVPAHHRPHPAAPCCAT